MASDTLFSLKSDRQADGLVAKTRLTANTQDVLCRPSQARQHLFKTSRAFFYGWGRVRENTLRKQAFHFLNLSKTATLIVKTVPARVRQARRRLFPAPDALKRKTEIIPQEPRGPAQKRIGQALVFGQDVFLQI
jgi:hypothetical protein